MTYAPWRPRRRSRHNISAHFAVIIFFSGDNLAPTNCALRDAKVPNKLRNLLASKAKLPCTGRIRAFNRLGPNTMTRSNVSAKNNIGISNILLKFRTGHDRNATDRRGGGEEREGGG